jgi:hypothetical protein
MSKKKPKYLIETSAIPPALGTTTPEYVRHFQVEVSGGTLFSSVFIRKEFLRRWICDTIRVALTLNQCDTWADALVHLEQDFGRKPKGALDVIQHLLRRTGTIDNNEAALEEVGTLAWTWLKLFDRRFEAKINNKSQCQIGGRELKIDGDALLADLYAFYEEFQKPILDCKVNEFLDLANAKGVAKTLLENAKAKECDSVTNLQVLADTNTHVTCRECGKIGDASLALEQPPSWCLVHVDKAFNQICDALGKDHKHIKSLNSTFRVA